MQVQKFIHEGVPVPFPVMWSAESRHFVGDCPHFTKKYGMRAIHQNAAQGQGVPVWGRPHLTRLRDMMARGLCDVCKKPIKSETKISLSKRIRGQDGTKLMEPLLHVECAKLALRMCPSLQRDQQKGILSVKRVFTYRVRPIMASPEDLKQHVPNYIGPPLISLAAIDLDEFEDVTHTDEWQVVLSNTASYLQRNKVGIVARAARWLSGEALLGKAR